MSLAEHLERHRARLDTLIDLLDDERRLPGDGAVVRPPARALTAACLSARFCSLTARSSSSSAAVLLSPSGTGRAAPRRARRKMRGGMRLARRVLVFQLPNQACDRVIEPVDLVDDVRRVRRDDCVYELLHRHSQPARPSARRVGGAEGAEVDIERCAAALQRRSHRLRRVQRRADGQGGQGQQWRSTRLHQVQDAGREGALRQPPGGVHPRVPEHLLRRRGVRRGAADRRADGAAHHAHGWYCETSGDLVARRRLSQVVHVPAAQRGGDGTEAL